jgi:hypothetical protein
MLFLSGLVKRLSVWNAQERSQVIVCFLIYIVDSVKMLAEIIRSWPCLRRARLFAAFTNDAVVCLSIAAHLLVHSPLVPLKVVLRTETSVPRAVWKLAPKGLVVSVKVLAMDNCQ